MLENRLPNQHFVRLKEQVTLENKICANRIDLFNQAFTLLCDSCFEPDDRDAQVGILREALSRIDGISLSNILDVLSCLHIVNTGNSPRLSRFSDEVPSILHDVARTDRLPISVQGMVLYFSKLDDQWSQHSQSLELRLREEGRGSLANRSLDFAIDAFFGTSHFLSTDEVSDFLNQTSTRHKELSREKLSKAILELAMWDQPVPEVLISSLESKIEDDFANWVVPDILFSLIESEKLVNSNIPSEHIEPIFTAIKKAGSEWATIIESVRQDAVVIDLKRFVRMPSFSPIEDVLSLLALSKLDRQFVYQVEEQQYLQYLRYKTLDDATSLIGRSGTRRFASFVACESLLWSAVTILGWQPIPNYFRQLNQTSLVPKTLGELSALIASPILLGFFLIVWCVRVWKRLGVNGMLTAKDVFTNIPIISKLISG